MDIKELRQYIFELNKITYESRGENFEPSKRAIELARDSDEPQLLAYSFTILGAAYALAGKVDQSIRNLDSANELFNSYPHRPEDDPHIGYMHCGYGITYDNTGELAKALWHHEQSLSIANRTAIGYDQQRAYLNIGYVYFRMGAGDQAIDYLSRAVRHPEQSPFLLPNAHAHIGEAFLLRKQYDKAKESFFEALKLKLHNAMLKKHASSAALCFIMMGNLSEGKKFLQIAKETETRLHEANIDYLLVECRYLMVIGDLESAYEMAEQIHQVGKSAGNPNSQWKATLLKAEILLMQTHYAECGSLIETILIDPLPYPIRYQLLELKIELAIQTENWKEAVLLQKELGENEFINQSRLLTMSKLNEEMHRSHIAEEMNEILRKKNHELEILHEEKDEIVQIVAHDLKNPIASASLTLELLITHGENLASEKRQRSLTRLADSIGRIKDIVSQLVISSEIENQMEEVQFHEIRLDLAVEKLVEQNLGLAQSKGQLLTFASHSPMTMYGHPAWVEQIVSNLISNAIKFTQKGGVIEVKLIADHQKQTTRLEVTDNGQGLSEDDMAHIFKKYKKLSSSPTGGESSTGLGLYIIRQLVEKMEGNVSVESTGKGQGSTFLVEFNLVD